MLIVEKLTLVIPKPSLIIIAGTTLKREKPKAITL